MFFFRHTGVIFSFALPLSSPQINRMLYGQLDCPVNSQFYKERFRSLYYELCEKRGDFPEGKPFKGNQSLPVKNVTNDI